MTTPRTVFTAVQRTHAEAGAPIEPATVIAIAAAAVPNPLAGRGRVADLAVLEELGRDIAESLVAEALTALAAQGLEASDVRGYGKGCIVGTDGDREHSAAILHPRFGAPVRSAIGGGTDIIPGTKKVGPPGSMITIPIGNRDDRWQFDDMDAIDFVLPDAPRSDEVLVVLALSCGGRPGARTRKPS